MAGWFAAVGDEVVEVGAADADDGWSAVGAAAEDDEGEFSGDAELFDQPQRHAEGSGDFGVGEEVSGRCGWWGGWLHVGAR